MMMIVWATFLVEKEKELEVHTHSSPLSLTRSAAPPKTTLSPYFFHMHFFSVSFVLSSQDISFLPAK